MRNLPHTVITGTLTVAGFVAAVLAQLHWVVLFIGLLIAEEIQEHGIER